MYKSRLKSWDLLKNAKKDDWGVLAVLFDRERRAGKHITAFSVRGRRRTLRDLQKYIRSLNLTEDEFLARQEPELQVPDHIVATTEPATEEYKDSTPGDSDSFDFATPTSSESKSVTRSPETRTVSDSRSVTRSPQTGRLDSPIPAHSTTFSSTEHPPSNTDTIRNAWDNIWFERVQDTIMDVPENHPASVPCDQLQVDLEVMGRQVTSPVLLASGIGADDIDTFWLVNASPVTSMPGTPSSEVYCSRCNQPASFHSASFHALRRPASATAIESRSILNSSPAQGSKSTHTWNISNSTRYDDGAWKWPSRCYLACIQLRNGDVAASDRTLADASQHFEQMLLSRDPNLLTSAQVVTVILAMHQQGPMTQTIMNAARDVAQRCLADVDPIRTIIECLAIQMNPDALRESRFEPNVMKHVYNELQTMYGAHHPYAIQASYSVGVVLRCFGSHQEANDVLQRTYHLSRSVLGERHLLTIFSLATLGVTQSLLKQTEQAVRSSEAASREAAVVLGVSHPYTLEAKRRLALAILASENPEPPDGESDADMIVPPSNRVEDLYWDVLRGRVKMLGSHHDYTLGAREDYQSICQQRGTWTTQKEEFVRRMFDELPSTVKQQSKGGSTSDSEEEIEAF